MGWGYRSKLWQKHDLKVHFLSPTTPLNLEGVILEWASEWSRHCAIQFHKTNDAKESDIRVDFKDSGAWSYTGSDASIIQYQHQTMNLAFADKPTVLHEFGHTLGLSHEHQSPFFAGIEWDKEKVMKSLSGPPHYWDLNRIRNLLLLRRPLTTDSVGTAYDPKSIMHYSYPKEWFKISTSAVTEVNKDLSDGDKKLVKDLYGGPRGPFKLTEDDSSVAEEERSWRREDHMMEETEEAKSGEEDTEGCLTIKDFKVVRRAVFTIRRKWFSLGLELDCSKDDLDTVEYDYPGSGNSERRLDQTLDLWLRRSSPQPTWEALILALKQPTVGEEALSIEIAGKYGDK